jgi:transcriptional regulator with XRE-family HTH domain
MNYKERVGLNINYYRKLSGLTLKQVADKVGITEATMEKYEAGQIKRVDIEMIENIASAIDTTAANLTGWLSKEEEELAHNARIQSRNDKWKSVYERLPYQKQKLANAYLVALENGDDYIIDIDEEKLSNAIRFFEKFQSASPQVREAIEVLLKSQ